MPQNEIGQRRRAQFTLQKPRRFSNSQGSVPLPDDEKTLAALRYEAGGVDNESVHAVAKVIQGQKRLVKI